MTTRELFGMRLREQQARILEYPEHPGLMGVSAVPGSGKTQTLALLAAQLIVEGHVDAAGSASAEVLVVTVQNSAVDQIAGRIRKVLSEVNLPPVGFRVCTLHKLASDIVRERYDLAGVEDSFLIVDDAESRRTMQNAANVWRNDHASWWESFLPDGSDNARTKARERWQVETEEVGRGVSKLCKHLRLTPEAARVLVSQASDPGDWLPMGVDLYALYASYLQARNGLDFDDLIWRAIEALEQDPAFVANLRLRWPFILEDEAQDSSPLQQLILGRLAGAHGRWVRVGDPNQAINSTFTSADPRFFRAFIERPDVLRLPLAESGRSGRPIIALANHLVQWTCQEHPEPTIRDQAFEQQEIRPTSTGDPQVNPPDEECHLHLRELPFESIDAEAARVAEWSASYVQRYGERTLAILCPAGWQGNQVVEALQAITPPVLVDDLLRSTPKTRDVARLLQSVCNYLATPMNRSDLARMYGVLAAAGYLGGANLDKQAVKMQQQALRSLAPADFVYPREPGSVRDQLPHVPLSDDDAAALTAFGRLVRRWVNASDLAIDQLLLTIAQDLFTDDGDLAVCHLLASNLGSAAQMHPDWRLHHFAAELHEIASNKRALASLSLVDAGFEPQKGHIAVTTMHKAKGLEWDAVFIICADNLEFPDTREDAFRDAPYFMPGRAPKVEACKLLERLAEQHTPGSAAALGEPEAGLDSELPLLEQARLEYIAERLRLLYVGITRARRDLSITWSQSSGQRKQQPMVLRELQRFVRDVWGANAQ